MTDDTPRPIHSPLGASGAERWMNCPGSVALIKALTLEESDEPDYRAEGTAGHEWAAKLLSFGQEPWELLGEKASNGTEADVEMTDALAVWTDTCRPLFTPGSKVMIEFPVSSPRHPKFYGTLDLAVITWKAKTVDVNDLKLGKGVVVEVEDNPQILYYAYGLLDAHPEIEDDWTVRLRIVQPRAFHQDGPVRLWEVTAGYVRQWAHNTLFPAMAATEVDDKLDAGEHCRFCPAKLVCPMLTGLFRAAATCNPKTVIELTNDSLGRDRALWAAVKLYGAALEAETYKRLDRGETVLGTKLVAKKANRVFKPGAASVFRAQYGAQAYTTPELRSPAEMERIAPGAKTLVKQWAFTPQTGLTVALESDSRQGVKVRTLTEAFGNREAAA